MTRKILWTKTIISGVTKIIKIHIKIIRYAVMTIAELKQKLGQAFQSWQIIEFGAKNINAYPLEFTWINMYELKTDNNFNIFFHEIGHGNICVEVFYSRQFLLSGNLSSPINDIKLEWHNSERFNKSIDPLVNEIIDKIYNIYQPSSL